MPVEYTKGDLFKTENLDALAHGCNTQGHMGKGIALQFKVRFSDMYKAYRQMCINDEFNLDDVFVWDQDEPIVFNLATQPKIGPYANLQAIDRSLRKMVAIAEERNLNRIGLPHIGAGIGGLDWQSIKSILDEIGSKTDVTLVVVAYQSTGRSR